MLVVKGQDREKKRHNANGDHCNRVESASREVRPQAESAPYKSHHDEGKLDRSTDRVQSGCESLPRFDSFQSTKPLTMSHSTGNVLALGLAIFATLTCHSVYGFGFGFGGGGGHFDEMMHHGGIHQYEHSFHPVHMFKKFKMKKAVPMPVIIKPIIVDRKVPVKVSWFLFNCFQIAYLKFKLN